VQKKITLKLLPHQAVDDVVIKQYAATALAIPVSSITGYHLEKKSIDARSRQVWVNLSLHIFINEPYRKREILSFSFRDVKKSNHTVVIIGSGPAGLFAALHLIESGIKPVILERGKDVKSRRRDLAHLNKEGEINPDSNYCFGEGGAGTYSDGKLYTRSTKRGDVNRILHLFRQFGAPENIIYESHPHIGTNKLPGIITSIREKILECGGEIHFNCKVADFSIANDSIVKVITEKGDSFSGKAVILATGHSARDVFHLLHTKKIETHFKPFALGVRIEHPQSVIDGIQFHCDVRSRFLPPAAYSLVQQVEKRGVFSFCMCPGGIIAPAATSPGEIVVNGWSPSKRNNPYANSGIVVSVEEKDVQNYKKYGSLAGMYFQMEVEQKAWSAGGGKMVAPAQRLIDFCDTKFSNSLPDCSYIPGVNSAMLNDVLPSFVFQSLKYALREFGRKMPGRFGRSGFFTNQAIVVATESRTSSPVRIPRDSKTLHHPQIKNLYPCGEGAGYAGGIVSAAMDGEKGAGQIADLLLRR
jgi:uncharacterized FAD-dependent dehydrogenase